MLLHCLMSYLVLPLNARTQYMKAGLMGRTINQIFVSVSAEFPFPPLQKLFERVWEEKVNLFTKIKFHTFSPRTESEGLQATEKDIHKWWHWLF